MFIVFEGPDNVGKTTIAKAVAEQLGALCYAFPGSEPDTLGEEIYRLHHSDMPMSALSKQALHIAAHLDAYERVIFPTLEAGQHVVLDRFWWSTLVYGRVYDCNWQVLAALVDVERELLNLYERNPDIIYLITADKPIVADYHSPEQWSALMSDYNITFDLAQRGGYDQVGTTEYEMVVNQPGGAITTVIDGIMKSIGNFDAIRSR